VFSNDDLKQGYFGFMFGFEYTFFDYFAVGTGWLGIAVAKPF
jgi:hypothetical protein